jgi:hypothetical protein
MDFVTTWKASSIVLTGAFGILGLLKDFRDKETKKITVWGYISLAGILLSSALGVTAQLKESSAEERTKVETAKQTLTVVQNTGKVVRDIQRILSPLDDPEISLGFTVSCQDAKYESACKALEAIALEGHENHRGFELDQYWSYWPGGASALLPLHLHFFADPKDAELFVQGKLQKGNLSMDVIASNYANDKSLHFNPDTRGTGVSLDIDRNRPLEIDNDGKIRSVLDIPGTTLIITELNDELSRLTLNDFEIKLKNGQSIEIWQQFEKIKVRGQTAYRHVFPIP